MTKYWFKPKTYGYGFCPITWEGWFTTIILIALIILSAYINNLWKETITVKEGFRFFLDTVILSGIFTALFKDKVEGGLQWRWGNKQ